MKALERSRLAGFGACMLLAGVTCAIYWQIRDHEFLNFDDPHYVSAVPHVLHGLTPQGIAWAFTVPLVACPHPFTYISLMLDSSIYGTDPQGYLLTNLLLHVSSTLILFWVLWRSTGNLFPAFVVAAVFGWHPTHAESVAWISERKDVLSVFFFTVTLAGYISWRTSPRPFGYTLKVLIPFACALLSKPSMVVVPALLLLVDIWPLRRFESDLVSCKSLWSWTRVLTIGLLRAIPEKLPLFIAAGVTSALTIAISQSVGATAPSGALPLWNRLIHAVQAVGFYLEKFFLPFDLSPLHVHPRSLPSAQCTAFLLTIIALLVTFALLRARKNEPQILIGLAWFFVCVLPICGVFQNGIQLVANRYTYLAYVGLAISLAYGASAVVRGRIPRLIAATAAWLWLAFLAWHTTYDAVPVWRDSKTLWQRAARVDPNEINTLRFSQTLLAYRDYAGARVFAQAALHVSPDLQPAKNILAEINAKLEAMRAAEPTSIAR